MLSSSAALRASRPRATAQVAARSFVSSSVALGKMNRYSEKITQSKSQGASQVRHREGLGELGVRESGELTAGLAGRRRCCTQRTASTRMPT